MQNRTQRPLVVWRYHDVSVIWHDYPRMQIVTRSFKKPDGVSDQSANIVTFEPARAQTRIKICVHPFRIEQFPLSSQLLWSNRLQAFLLFPLFALLPYF